MHQAATKVHNVTLNLTLGIVTNKQLLACPAGSGGRGGGDASRLSVRDVVSTATASDDGT